MQTQKLDPKKFYYSVRNPKIQKLIKEQGCVSFGIYICIVDLLVDAEENKLPYSEWINIAKHLDVPLSKMDAVLFDYNLFKNVGGNYFTILQD